MYEPSDEMSVYCYWKSYLDTMHVQLKTTVFDKHKTQKKNILVYDMLLNFRSVLALPTIM